MSLPLLTRNRRWHERMSSDSDHVVNDALLRVFEREPFDVVPRSRAASAAYILPLAICDSRRFQALREQVANDVVCESQHPAVGVMNGEPLLCAEQVVRKLPGNGSRLHLPYRPRCE
jgi:hypothetical protein